MGGKAVISICLVWGMACALLYTGGRLFPLAGIPMADYLFIGAGLYSASIVMNIYMRQVEPRIHARKGRRPAWLACLFAGGLGLAGLAGFSSSFLSACLTLILILFASVTGAWLATHLKRPAEIVPLGIVVSLADMFSLAKGPTQIFSRQLSDYYEGGMEGVPPLVDFFLVKIPMPGQEAFMPVFGVTDWIVITFLSAAAAKFHMDDRLGTGPWKTFGAFPAAVAGLMAAIVLARETRIFLPALPFVIAVFLGVMMVRYPEMRRLTKAELVPMAWISALLIALMI